MRVKPNRTTIRGRVKEVRPPPPGAPGGAEVALEVIENESRGSEADYLQPAAGDILDAYVSRAPAVKPGDVVRVNASLSAGPFGERVVLESVEPLKS
jgi:hypothetical protein